MYQQAVRKPEKEKFGSPFDHTFMMIIPTPNNRKKRSTDLLSLEYPASETAGRHIYVMVALNQPPSNRDIKSLFVGPVQ